eukprot:m.343430 g.343430  ORF g.343430 m.343430 type:complete len:373 (+) comp22812_c0_seq1:39-1157(+)
MVDCFLFILLPLAAYATPPCNVCPAGSPGAVGGFDDAMLTLSTSPIGNGFATNTSFSIHGVTGQQNNREFVVNLGLTSNMGTTAKSTPYRDKVCLYTGVVAENGTGDVWSINPLLTQAPNSGSYDAQGIELDFNNNNANRGETDAGGGLAPPVSYGLSVTGAGGFRSTSAILVSGPGVHRIWNRGITFANDCVTQSTFQDLGNPSKSIDIRGNPEYGIYQSSKSSKNYFAGKTTTADLVVEGDILYSGRLLQQHDQHETVDLLRNQPSLMQQGKIAVRTRGCVNVSAISPIVLARKQYSGVMTSQVKRILSSEELKWETSYQLTALLKPMPNLYVSKLVEDEQIHTGNDLLFEVCGGSPEGYISWQITHVVL